MANGALPNSTLSDTLGRLLNSYKSGIVNRNPTVTNSPLLGTDGKAPKNPVTAYETKNPFEQWAQPSRDTQWEWAYNVARPEFNEFTLNPFQRQYGNQVVSSNMGLQGNAQQLYQRQEKQVTQPFIDMVEAARQQSENDLLSRYNIMRGNYYDNLNIIPPTK